MSDIQTLALEVTSHCNIKCPQCSRTDWNGELAAFVNLKNWDVDKILPNLRLDSMPNLKVFALEGDNGDAAMHPKIERIIDAAVDAASLPYVFLVTNGSMRKPRWWGNLAKRYGERLVIQFSIDGLSDTHHLYRVGSDYDQVIANAQAFIDNGGSAVHRCLVFRHNQHQLQEISEKSRSMGFKKMLFRAGDMFRFQGLTQWPVYWQSKQIHMIEPAKLIAKEQYLPWEFDFFSNSWKPKPNESLCPYSRRGQFHITYQGHVLPCCMYQADLYFDHQSNDAFRKFVGDVDCIDVNLRPLDEIFSDEDFYIKRLQNNLGSKSRLPNCHTSCGSQIDQLMYQSLRR